MFYVTPVKCCQSQKLPLLAICSRCVTDVNSVFHAYSTLLYAYMLIEVIGDGLAGNQRWECFIDNNLPLLGHAIVYNFVCMGG